MSKLGLYARTIKRMKPTQVVGRLHRTRIVDVGGTPRLADGFSILLRDTDLADNYLERFDVDLLVKSNTLLLLNSAYVVDSEAWQIPEASHLWNFNLHYFEYAIALGEAFRKTQNNDYWMKFKSLVTSWIGCCKYAQGDAWHPYTISLRLVNWLVCRDLFKANIKEDEAFDALMQNSMYLQYRHLLANQEKHLLANHYLENLKTLVICALLFGEDDVLAEIECDYLAQLDEQVLPDGVHYERSMMYHKLILEGVLRVELAYRSAGKVAPAKVASKARQMLDAMASIERGMGKTPFFNDAADGVAKECKSLICACRDVYGYEPDDTKTAFPDSGFYKLYDGNAALVFFAGEPGPQYMLGHAHCDLLSFELSVGDRPVIVNSGTYAYQSDLRPYFRSTAAHNTATVDGDEQMECWAEHRVARGVSAVRVEECDGTRIVASFRNYKGLLHRRRVEMCGGLLTVEDSTDRPDAEIVQHFHLLLPELVSIKACDSCLETMSKSVYSAGFGVQSAITEVGIVGLEKASVLIVFGRRYDD